MLGITKLLATVESAVRSAAWAVGSARCMEQGCLATSLCLSLIVSPQQTEVLAVPACEPQNEQACGNAGLLAGSHSFYRLQQTALKGKRALQAHYVEFTARDIAMSKSLNSDYLAQLYIRADTKKMDKTLVHDSVEGKGLPSEAEALLVFKRG